MNPNTNQSPLQVLAPALASDLTPLLRENRAAWNARFAVARQQFPALDADTFLSQLCRNALPILAATHAHTPERTQEVWETLWEFSLTLVGRGSLGHESAIAFGWQRVLPHLAPLIVQNPRRVIGTVSNALHTLRKQSSQRDAVQKWCDAMQQIAPLCPNLETFERAGFVASWRCGIAHARPNALQILSTLSPEIGRVALGIKTTAGENWPQLLQVLAADNWFDPRAANVQNHAAATPQLAAQIGEFVGFGGAMSEPPRVNWAQNRFWVWNGGRWMHLWADAFGATLTYTSQTPQLTAQTSTNWRIWPDGRVQYGEKSQQLAQLQSAHSWAEHDRTLVVTTPFSHRVFIVKC